MVFSFIFPFLYNSPLIFKSLSPFLLSPFLPTNNLHYYFLFLFAYPQLKFTITQKIEKYRIRFIFLQFEKHYFLKFYPKLSIAFPSFKTRKKFLLVWKKFREIPNASKRIKKDKYSESKLSEIIKNKKN